MKIPKYFYFRVRVINKGTGVKVEDASDADVVEVVRCKDCRYCGNDEMFDEMWCDGKRVSADWFCADGERKDEVTDE